MKIIRNTLEFEHQCEHCNSELLVSKRDIKRHYSMNFYQEEEYEAVDFRATCPCCGKGMYFEEYHTL